MGRTSIQIVHSDILFQLTYLARIILTLTRKNVTPYVGSDLAVLVYIDFASFSFIPELSELCDDNE